MSLALFGTGYELILNASEGALQIAVTHDEKLLCFQQWHTENNASEILASVLADIFRVLDLNARYFRRIACVTGPGSFTGIRLVLSTAAALRRVSKAQLGALDYLQALACTAVINRGALYSVNVAVLTHARKNLVHFQRFCSYGPQIPPVAVGDVRLIEPEAALLELAGSGSLVCGSGLGRNPEIFAIAVNGKGLEKAPDLILLPELIHPDAKSLCLLARHGDYFPKDLEPRYIRGCDAVENLEHAPDSEQRLQKLQIWLAKFPQSEI